MGWVALVKYMMDKVKMLVTFCWIRNRYLKTVDLFKCLL